MGILGRKKFFFTLLGSSDSFKNQKKILIYLFYFWLHWFFVAACRLSLVVVIRGYSSLRCAGFSLQWLLLLQSTGSRCTGFSGCGLQVLEYRLRSCCTWAQLLCSMWDLPGLVIKPMSPALVGGFLTTAPPGKPSKN